MTIEKYDRYWAVYDNNNELVCVTVYKKGAVEVVKRLTELKNELLENKQSDKILI